MPDTLDEILTSQRDLVTEAALALPHQFSQCTYSLGHIRQAVYLCLTCALPRGICSACSIACHTDHEQVELFPKRNFRCDCPTIAIPHVCTLHGTPEDENIQNVYKKNFMGQFCRCGRPYDAKTERETMIQCLACEDWFHESCLNLRERPSSREPSPVPVPPSALVPNTQEDDEDDAASEASSSGLPPSLIAGSSYDSFICAGCVSQIDTVKRLAGTKGAMMVVRDNSTQPWRILGADEENEDGLVDVQAIDDSTAEGSMNTGMKRPRSPSDNDAQNKKARVSTSTSNVKCLAPAPNTFAQDIFASGIVTGEKGAGDLFLTDGWRSRWCRCSSCLPSLEKHPYLLEEEETYEPPEDPDSGFSLEELGMRALQNLPRDRAIDGIRAFNEMRDDLMAYLRPFAEEGKVVSEEDVRGFFEARMEAARAGRV